ncbi:MAG: hypothetical protein IKQ25_00040 [Lachnospiraceae bacterium]|nr:hypothetical protein [Lachnospiraceae bacterium]
MAVVGDATRSAGKCVKYVSKFADNPSVALELLTFLEKNCPDIAKEVAKSDDFISAMEKLAKSDLSKLTKAEREALEELYERNGLKELIKSGSDAVSWSNHGYKHFPNKNMSWMDIVNSTKSGPAKYSFDIQDVEAFERAAWEAGTPVTNGKNWRVNKFETTIGAVNGRETVYVRIENSSNTIHGHPISEAEYYKLLKEH